MPSKRHPTRWALLSCACATMMLSSPSQADDIVGVWFNETGRGAIAIEPCDNNLCGHIVWLEETTGKDGQPLSDKRNPEAANRSRPICGLQILGGLSQQPDGSWDDGWIYDPQQGKSFDVQLILRAPTTLEVLGYKGLKIFSRKMLWRRAPADLGTC